MFKDLTIKNSPPPPLPDGKSFSTMFAIQVGDLNVNVDSSVISYIINIQPLKIKSQEAQYLTNIRLNLSDKKMAQR